MISHDHCSRGCGNWTKTLWTLNISMIIIAKNSKGFKSWKGNSRTCPPLPDSLKLRCVVGLMYLFWEIIKILYAPWNSPYLEHQNHATTASALIRMSEWLFVREIIFTSKQFWKFLMEMKNHIRIAVFSRYGISPQFLHEKYLIGKLRRGTYLMRENSI